MDSINIYESAKTYIQSVTWIIQKNSNDSEWIFIGTQNNLEDITKNIQDFLVSDQLYIVINRRESFKTDKKLINDNIKPLIGNVDFSIWNFQFDTVIEFNKIGIYRVGKR